MPGVYAHEAGRLPRMIITRACLLTALLTVTAAANADPKTAPPKAPAAAAQTGCLPSGNGYLRARIRGAMNLDINWHNAELECDGGARPDGSGIRVSFAGPRHSDGRRVRLVFGVHAAEGSAGRALPTNLTVIFEGERRLFATRGEDRCTVDQLEQQRVGALGGRSRSYRIVARGFCTEPASALSGHERIVVNSFDFAGRVTFEEPEPEASGTTRT